MPEKKLLSGKNSGHRRSSTGRRPSRRKPRRVWFWPVVAILVLAVGAGGYFWLANRKPTPGGVGQTPGAGRGGETQDGAQKGASERVGQGSASESKASRQITMDTSRGQIVIEIYPELMPITTANFEKLVKSGFYNGLTFHRVEDWVVQGGDPRGNGTGGPGWTIKLETNPQLKNVRGAVAMARSREPDTAGSQFYILKKDASWLDGQYAVFGKVLKGMDVVDQLAIGDKLTKVTE